MRAISPSLRTMLVSLVLLCLAPLVLITVHSHVRYRGVMTGKIQQDLQRLTREIASTNGDLAEDTRHLLQYLSEMDYVKVPKRGECVGALRSVLKNYPQYLNLGVAAPDGNVFCSAIPMQRPVNISDREYFQCALKSRSFAVGRYQVGRITGKESLNFGYPVLDGEGRVTAVVFAAMDLRTMNAAFERAQLPAGSVITAIDREGKILMRYPDGKTWVGKTVRDIEIVSAMLKEVWGTMFTRGLDGVERIYSFAPLFESGVFVTVGVPEDVAYAEANRIFALNLIVLGFVALGAFASATFLGDYIVVRKIGSIIDSMRGLKKGDLGARAEATVKNSLVGEIRELAVAFDDMASSLEASKREAGQAINALLKEEEKYRSLLENSTDIIAVLGVDGKINYMSPSCEKILGYPPEDIAGKSVEDFVHWEDGQKLKDAIGQVISLEGGMHAEEIRFRRKDGSVAYLEAVGKSIVNEAGLEVVVNARDITERKRQEEMIEDKVEKLSALRKIDVAILSSLDLQVSLDIFLGQALPRLRVDAADILILDPRTHTLECMAARGFKADPLKTLTTALGADCAGRIALERKPLIIHDPSEAGGHACPRLAGAEDFRAYVGVPLIAKGDVKGVFEVFSRRPLKPDKDWLDFIDALAQQAAIAIDNAMMFDDLKRSHSHLIMAYDSTIEGWSRALDYRDKETEGHSRRVTDMTVRIATTMGMTEEELVHVRRGALLHDIGKLGVPDAVLFKPGKLTAEEWAMMKRHPVIAKEILSPIPFLRPALDIPYCHHERWDGTGYPRGLKGEEIPLSARIFSVVDVWDALSSDRPYRPAWPRERAEAEIRSGAGAHFDPEVADMFLKMKR